MSLKDAVRRAELRELLGEDPHSGARRPRSEPRPEGALAAGWYSPDGTPTTRDAPGPKLYYELLELTPEEREGLRYIAARYSYADELLAGLEDDGRISQAALYNAQMALEEDTGEAWPTPLPLAGPELARKIGALFDRLV